jgi:hypothetical protein
MKGIEQVGKDLASPTLKRPLLMNSSLDLSKIVGGIFGLEETEIFKNK